MFDIVKKLATMALVAAVIGCGSQAPKQDAKPAEPAVTAEVKNLPSMTVASIAKTGPYTGAGQTMAELVKWAETNKVVIQGTPFGIYLSDPKKVAQGSLNYEICIPVAPETRADEKAGVAVKPAGGPGVEIAATIHAGPFDQVSATYERLVKWIADNGYQVAGPGLEFYLTDPSKTPAESLKTEVAFPVTKAEKTQ